MHRILLCFALAALLFAPAMSAQAGPCDASLQSLIDATPSGGVLLLPACIYRQTVTIDRPMTLDGQGHAEIRGSDHWTAWRQRGSTWVSGNVLPPFDNGNQAVCEDPRCNWPEQVFYNGTPLTQVAVGVVPTSGQFSLTSGRHVVLADNPGGQVIEVNTRTAGGGVKLTGMTNATMDTNVVHTTTLDQGCGAIRGRERGSQA